MDKITLGQRLREVREKLGYDAQYVGIMTGMSKQHVANIEKGRVTAKKDKIDELLKLYKITLDELT